MRDSKGRFVKGHILGFKKGYKQSKRTKKIISETHKGKFKSESYNALHYWIRTYGPDKRACEICKKKNCFLEWASKSHEYKRDLDDWMLVCRSCHKKYDIRKGFVTPTWSKGNIPWNQGKNKKDYPQLSNAGRKNGK